MLRPTPQHVLVAGQLEVLKLEPRCHGTSHEGVPIVANNLGPEPCTSVHDMLRRRFWHVEGAEKKRVITLVVEDMDA